ncbi:putative nuclear protein Qri2/Nse4 [Eremomyces bilateralis CBS 781.70]|uniref:Non-structural maintenance of chromosomes element 4 n=1 Tax=Eremomyces bilateralis CBS 781.70 TaxID=1392243 RepID=A0A6G1FS39_9PEZI|nr:putative nuclear protein Qri2/Nse4 [Eremomyces bilateralis CBS 781.70]KAF1808538.1 putative nuclear protein Qri2/Nse4 [Eremomyces bilateralis CBS 781.70]
MAQLNTAASPDSVASRRYLSLSVLSDKENAPQARKNRSKGKAPMERPTTERSVDTRSPKRRRLEEVDPNARHRAREEDNEVYDPNQNEEERRRIRLGMRAVEREVKDRHQELMQPDNTEINGLLERQNVCMDSVRQTADATIDSRILHGIGDLIHKKTTAMTLGDSSTGVDVDEFVSKCISFMRLGGAGNGDDRPANTQTQRRRARRNVDEDEDDEDGDGDACAWDVFGEQACFPSNRRPAVSGFLLGPLSVQKRVRQSQRRVGLRRDTQGPVTKPKEITREDLEQTESNDTPSLCKKIRDLLVKEYDARRARITPYEDQLEDMDEEEAETVFKNAGLANDWNMSLFQFAINPSSFGQTVENLFYISFMVKDGGAALGQDENGFPTIRYENPPDAAKRREQELQRNQAIFSLDWATWEKLIKLFNIRTPMIPHREYDTSAVRGWYG